MDTKKDKIYAGKLIMAVLTEKISVREAITMLPNTKDKNIECVYHALVHYVADEEIRYRDIEYREEQDEYLEFLSHTLMQGKDLPRNIIADYEDYYKGTSKVWKKGLKGFWEEFTRFINI